MLDKCENITFLSHNETKVDNFIKFTASQTLDKKLLDWYIYMDVQNLPSFGTLPILKVVELKEILLCWIRPFQVFSVTRSSGEPKPTYLFN